jgi:molybdate transport system permease protein
MTASPVARPLAGARAGGLPLASLAGLFAVFLALPVATLVLRAVLGGSLLDTAASSAVMAALGLSLGTTAISLAITIAVGLPLAYVLARREFRGKWLVEAIVDLPIVLPPAVAGLALLLVLGRRGVLGEPLEAAGLDIAFTTVAVVVAQVFVSAPFFVRSARAGLAAVDRDLEDAARVDGASELGLFRAITVPLAGPSLAAGLVMSWARALVFSRKARNSPTTVRPLPCHRAPRRLGRDLGAIVSRQPRLRTSKARPQWSPRTAMRTPSAATTRMAAAAIDASRSPPWNSE